MLCWAWWALLFHFVHIIGNSEPPASFPNKKEASGKLAPIVPWQEMSHAGGAWAHANYIISNPQNTRAWLVYGKEASAKLTRS